MRSDLVDLDVTIHTSTTKMVAGEDRGAWLVESVTSSPKRVWIPKSQCEVEGGEPPTKRGTLTARESLLVEKGLI